MIVLENDIVRNGLHQRLRRGIKYCNNQKGHGYYLTKQTKKKHLRKKVLRNGILTEYNFSSISKATVWDNWLW